MSSRAWGPLDPPLEMGRGEARRLAELELHDPAYQGLEPSLIERGVQWVLAHVQTAFDRAGEVAPGGWVGILGLVALVVIAVLIVRWRLGPITQASPIGISVNLETSAAEYHARADLAAADGNWGEAIAERMRAIVRTGQEQALIDPQPGWTANEIAAQLGNALPLTRDHVQRAARVYDEIRYGGRTATEAAHRTVTEACALIRSAVSVPK